VVITLFGPVTFKEDAIVKFNELYKMFKTRLYYLGDNVLKLDMLGGTVHISTVRDKTQVGITDTVDVQWVHG
jgi:hypothetical protein